MEDNPLEKLKELLNIVTPLSPDMLDRPISAAEFRDQVQRFKDWQGGIFTEDVYKSDYEEYKLSLLIAQLRLYGIAGFSTVAVYDGIRRNNAAGKNRWELCNIFAPVGFHNNPVDYIAYDVGDSKP